MNKKQELQFKKVWKKATGQQNIVGDLIIKDFISSLLQQQRKEILEIIKKETNKLFVMEHEHDKNDTAYIPNSVDFEKKLIKIINSLK